MALKFKIAEICIDSAFDKMRKNLQTFKSITNLKVGDTFDRIMFWDNIYHCCRIIELNEDHVEFYYRFIEYPKSDWITIITPLGTPTENNIKSLKILGKSYRLGEYVDSEDDSSFTYFDVNDTIENFKTYSGSLYVKHVKSYLPIKSIQLMRY